MLQNEDSKTVEAAMKPTYCNTAHLKDDGNRVRWYFTSQ